MKSFMQKNYHNFNARTLKLACESYVQYLKRGGQFLVSVGGAMSTAKLGVSLAEMIRQNKIHSISTTGANLEEDIFNLIAADQYLQISDYRNLTARDEEFIRQQGFSRVTDTCIPIRAAVVALEAVLLKVWKEADSTCQSLFPHEYFYAAFDQGLLDNLFHGRENDSWVYAAWKHDIPIFVPGWEDSTMGNIFVGHLIKNNIQQRNIMRTGIDYMESLIHWVEKVPREKGFLQIGGGLAGDFAIAAVPTIVQSLGKDISLWNYFCQISDSTTSYGSYSGATPSEKITWKKIDLATHAFMIESDATIVVPLMFDYILNA